MNILKNKNIIKKFITFYLLLLFSITFAVDTEKIIIAPTQIINIPNNINNGFLSIVLKGNWQLNHFITLFGKIKNINIVELKISVLPDTEISPDGIKKFFQLINEIYPKFIIEELNLENLNCKNERINGVPVLYNIFHYIKLIKTVILPMDFNGNDERYKELSILINEQLTILGMMPVSTFASTTVKNGKSFTMNTIQCSNFNRSKIFTLKFFSTEESSHVNDSRKYSAQDDKTSELISRSKLLLESGEIDDITKNRIKEMLNKLQGLNAKNPNNDNERFRSISILDTIVGINIISSDIQLDNFVKKLINLKKEKQNQKIQQLKNENINKIYSIMQKTKENNKIVKTLFALVEDIVDNQVNNQNNKNSDTVSVKRNKKVILLHGLPGLGKTKTPQVFGEVTGIPVAVISGGDEKKLFSGGDIIYSGAEPGIITTKYKMYCGGTNIKNNKATKTMIFVIDEVDKCTPEIQNMLLSLLDNEQDFIDSYLKVPVDINNCIFVLTANNIHKIEAPLRDRCGEAIEVKSFSKFQKKAIAKRDFITAFGVNNITFTNEALDLIAERSEGAGARQLKQNTKKIIQYLRNNHNSTLPIKLTEEIVRKSLPLRTRVIPYNINASEVGYINGVLSSNKREGQNQVVENIITFISCKAFDSGKLSGKKVSIDPCDRYTIAIVDILQNLIIDILDRMSIAYRNVAISIGTNDLNYEDRTSLYSLLVVVWISAVSGKKIKTKSTIIASLLMDGKLTADSNVINKIEQAYQNGIRYIVVANHYIESVRLYFALKEVRREDSKTIYIHQPGKSLSKEEQQYNGLEICAVNNIDEAITYLLIDN